MEIGIIGLPNVGKSTLFNALTGARVAAENFPFTTIEPNIGVVPLADVRLDRIAKEYASAKVTPCGIRFVDIAGLVKGAHQGEGLGNKFLSHIRSVDALCHVIRCFKDDNVASAVGDLDPLGACEIVETELLLADIQQTEKDYERLVKVAKTGDKEAQQKVDVLDVARKGFNEGRPARILKLDPEITKEFQFLTAKPIIYVANASEDLGPALIDPVKKLGEKNHSPVVALCAKMEAEILELAPGERAGYYEAAGITVPGFQKLAEAGKTALGLISFFTANANEARAWLVLQGAKAAKAAGKIHTDMEKGFIRAEVLKFSDLERAGNVHKAKEQNLISVEGKDYEVQEGDIVFFRFHA